MRVVTKYYSGNYATVDITAFFFVNITYTIVTSNNGFSQDALTVIKYTNR